MVTADDLPKHDPSLDGMQFVSPAPPSPPVPTSPGADSRFLDALVLEYLDGHNWKVVNEFLYRTDVDALGVVHVPACFLTDFASVPRILWRILPPTGMYGKAAVLHDWIYRTPTVRASRAEADGVFLEAMQALGVSATVRQVMYRSVRWFGGSSYRDRQREKTSRS